jgi:hypothetical protein
MNYDALFRNLEKLLPEVTEVLLRQKIEHENIKSINKNIELIAKRLAKKVV